MKNNYLIFLFLLLFFGCSKTDLVATKKQSGSFDIQKMKTDSNGLSATSATIKTIHGDILFRFFPKIAPNTTGKIMDLIQHKFYDGLIIHRMIPNFVIQTGDPTGTNLGGSGTKIKLEKSDLQHIKGTIGLAHGFDVNSGDSQFYICLTTLPHLDTKYTVFGQVVEGFDVLSKLSKGDRIISISLDFKE